MSTGQFSIVQLEQGSKEWLEWRHKGIGASDAPVVMGECPWRKPEELLGEKRGTPRPRVRNAAMARGSDLESEARRCYVARIGIGVTPACLQSSRYEWLRASVDGISADRNVMVEIKCGESVYQKTSRYRTPPAYYYGQLQHILAVTGLGSLDFWCYWPGCPDILVPVARDDEYIARLIATEMAFWKKVQVSMRENASGQPSPRW